MDHDDKVNLIDPAESRFDVDEIEKEKEKQKAHLASGPASAPASTFSSTQRKQPSAATQIAVFAFSLLAVSILAVFVSILLTVFHLRSVNVVSEFVHITVLPNNNTASVHAHLAIPSARLSMHEVDVHSLICKIETMGGRAGVLVSESVPGIMAGGDRVLAMHLQDTSIVALDSIKYAWLKDEDIGPVLLSCRIDGHLIIFKNIIALHFGYNLPSFSLRMGPSPATSSQNTTASSPLSRTTITLRSQQDSSVPPSPVRSWVLRLFPRGFFVSGSRLTLMALTLELPPTTYMISAVPAIDSASGKQSADLVNALIAHFRPSTIVLFRKGESEFDGFVDIRLEHRSLNRTESSTYIHNTNTTLPSLQHVLLKALGTTLKDALAGLTDDGSASDVDPYEDEDEDEGVPDPNLSDLFGDLTHGTFSIGATPLPFQGNTLLDWALGSHTASILYTMDLSNPQAAFVFSGYASLSDGRFFEEGNSTFNLQFLADSPDRIDALWLQVSYRMLSSHRAQLLASVQVDQGHQTWLASMDFVSAKPSENITFQQSGIWSGNTRTNISARVWTTVQRYPEWTIQASNSTLDIDFKNRSIDIDVRADYNEIHEKVWATASYIWSGGILSGEVDIYLKTSDSKIKKMVIDTPQLSVNRRDKNYAAAIIIDTFDTYKFLTLYLTGEWSRHTGVATSAQGRLHVGEQSNPYVSISNARFNLDVNTTNMTWTLSATSDYNGNPAFLNTSSIGHYNDGSFRRRYGLDWVVFYFALDDRPRMQSVISVYNASAVLDLDADYWNVTVPVIYGQQHNTFDIFTFGTWTDNSQGFELDMEAEISSCVYGDGNGNTGGNGLGDQEGPGAVACDLHRCSATSTSLCIPLEHVCDGINHCLDYSDELGGCGGCPADTLPCGKTCLSTERICDGVVDCTTHGEDEQNCDIYNRTVRAISGATQEFQTGDGESSTTAVTSVPSAPKRVALSGFAYGISLFHLNVNKTTKTFKLEVFVLKNHLTNYISMLATGDYLDGWHRFYGINRTSLSVDYSHVKAGGIITGTSIAIYMTVGDRYPGTSIWYLDVPLIYRRTAETVEVRSTGNWTNDGSFLLEGDALYIRNNDGGTGLRSITILYNKITQIWNITSQVVRGSDTDFGFVHTSGRVFDEPPMYGILSARGIVDLRHAWSELYVLLHNASVYVNTQGQSWGVNTTAIYGSEEGRFCALSSGTWNRTDGLVIKSTALVTNNFRNSNFTVGLSYLNLLVNTTSREWSATTNVQYQNWTSYISGTASGLYQDGTGGWYGINATSIDLDYRRARPDGLIAGAGITALVSTALKLWNVTTPILYNSGQRSLNAYSQGLWSTCEGFSVLGAALFIMDNDPGIGVRQLRVDVNSSSHLWDILVQVQGHNGVMIGNISSDGRYLQRNMQYGVITSSLTFDFRQAWNELYLVVSNFSAYCDTHAHKWAVAGNAVVDSSMDEIEWAAGGSWTTTQGLELDLSGRGLLRRRTAALRVPRTNSVGLNGVFVSVDTTRKTFVGSGNVTWNGSPQFTFATLGNWEDGSNGTTVHVHVHAVGGSPSKPCFDLTAQVNATDCWSCPAREVQVAGRFDLKEGGRDWRGAISSWLDESGQVPQWFMLNIYAEADPINSSSTGGENATDKASLIFGLSPYYGRYGFEAEGGLQVEDWVYEAGAAFFVGRIFNPDRRHSLMFLTLFASFDFDPLLNISLVGKSGRGSKKGMSATTTTTSTTESTTSSSSASMETTDLGR